MADESVIGGSGDATRRKVGRGSDMQVKSVDFKLFAGSQSISTCAEDVVYWGACDKTSHKVGKTRSLRSQLKPFSSTREDRTRDVVLANSLCWTRQPAWNAATW